MLKKELTLYERDSDGILIGQEVKLLVYDNDVKECPELKGQTIKVIPLKRGELKKMFGMSGKVNDEAPETTKDDDGELILTNCKDPVYTKEEISFLKPAYTRSIVRTIFVESGIVVDAKSGKKDMKKNDEFGKNS